MSTKFFPTCQEFDRSADSSVGQGLFQLADSRLIAEAPKQRMSPAEPEPTLAALPMLPAATKTREQLTAEFEELLAKIKVSSETPQAGPEKYTRPASARPKLYPYRG